MSNILTHTGHYVDPTRLRLDDIYIEDIAHGLSNECRFAGQGDFYSVAQHSVVVANNLPPDLQLAGLLHDAAEAYLKDIPSPWKKHWWMIGYRYYHNKAMALIFTKFGVPQLTRTQRAALHAVDKAAGEKERFRLFKGVPYPTDVLAKTRIVDYQSHHPWEAWTPEKAERHFLKLFHKLMPDPDASIGRGACLEYYRGGGADGKVHERVNNGHMKMISTDTVHVHSEFCNDQMNDSMSPGANSPGGCQYHVGYQDDCYYCKRLKRYNDRCCNVTNQTSPST